MRIVGSVGDEATRRSMVPQPIHRGQTTLVRKVYDLRLIKCEHRVGQHQQRTRAPICYRSERDPEFIGTSHPESLKLQPQFPRSVLSRFQYLSLEDGIARVPENSHAGKVGDGLLEQLQRFPDYLSRHRGSPGDISAGMGETCDESRSYWIANADHHDRDYAGRIFGGQRRLRHHRNNDVNLEPDKLCRKLVETIKLPVRESIGDGDALSLDITKLAKPFLKGV